MKELTIEEKSLLLQDLCARLPYSVKCYPVITNGEPNTIGGYCEVLNDFYIREVGGWFPISMIKPYLRPMSSMTKEERKELLEIAVALSYNKDDIIIGTQINSFRQLDGVLDLFNSHHLDWRGLIEKGLALEAPEGMYNIKEK